eukprot:CAMPEP_0180131846 /NCGR_PEP_ID=MMETSP0986-20121125/8650_1 /TAXON_ID=697907 /ORGANISM="non described non described, Strain CCMP2293" /LENGTH=65 /DNA_ID=CAMNT_0022071775 /DNA_START=409 /DNA_END=606 /DNA_ORIENTATION=+
MGPDVGHGPLGRRVGPQLIIEPERQPPAHRVGRRVVQRAEVVHLPLDFRELLPERGQLLVAPLEV